MQSIKRRTEEIADHLASRRFGEPMLAAILDLAVEGSATFRSAGEKYGIDHGELWRAADSVPGLLELHAERQAKHRRRLRRARLRAAQP